MNHITLTNIQYSIVLDMFPSIPHASASCRYTIAVANAQPLKSTYYEING